MGIAAGRAAVPSTCWVSRSSSRNGSVRMSMIGCLLAVSWLSSHAHGDLYITVSFYLTSLDSNFLLPHTGAQLAGVGRQYRQAVSASSIGRQGGDGHDHRGSGRAG